MLLKCFAGNLKIGKESTDFNRVDCNERQRRNEPSETEFYL